MGLLLILLVYLTLHIVFGDLPCLPRPGAPGEGAVCVCSALYCDSVERPPRLPPGNYLHYTTSRENPGFSRRTGYFIQDTSEVDIDVEFKIKSTIEYQTILGFGGSFTDASGVVVSSLPKKAQEYFIESYFGPTGIEYNLCRTPIGGSDFSNRWYTLADTLGDKDLQYFDLAEEDYKFKIPYIKRAMSVSSRGLSLIACPWTAPQWMKTKNRRPSDLTGYLKSELFHTWAAYYVKFIKAYKANDIDIWAISGANEPILPLAGKHSLNNTVSLAQEHREWLKLHLKPQLRAANLTHVKFFTLEDMRPFMLYWMDRLAADPVAFELVDGVALHWYMDSLWRRTDVMDIVHSKYPDKTILYTESSINMLFDRPSEAVKLGSWNRAAIYTYFIIENLSHWASGFTDWNLALNTEGGPTTATPIDAAVIVNVTSGEFYKQPIFYAMGHFSKFIPPGSRRVHVQVNESKGFQAQSDWPVTYPVVAPDVILCFATANSDGSYTSIVFNNKNVTVKMKLDVPNLGSITLGIEKNSINTFVYWQ